MEKARIVKMKLNFENIFESKNKAKTHSDLAIENDISHKSSARTMLVERKANVAEKRQK